MDSNKEINYLNNYQYNYLQNANNLYKMLDIKRQCLDQTVKACHVLEKENIIGTILQEKLEEYNKLIDDHTKINNNVHSVSSLTSSVNKTHCLQWTSEIQLDFNLIQSLQCCSNNQPTDIDNDAFFNRSMTVESIDSKFEVYSANKQNNVLEENSSKHTVKRNSYAVFKSARDELDALNTKKYKFNQNSKQLSSFPYGGQKKSLGARRGIQGKFIPPVRAEYAEESNGSNTESEEVEDERLKNIDPKMIELIRSEIMDSGVPISWEDIAGLDFAKTIIKEIIIWPLLRPDIFTGLRRPPKGILLFGPPGTGKTLIGKCIASQSQSTFFSISASSLTSKWVGDGEKMVRAMFAVARCHQPAVVFIDEIDSLLSQRSDTEHESSRRIKTEFLVQLDGAATGEEDHILVVGATNRPQELDEAARRRFVKRLYIPLPDRSARLEIVKRLITNERNELSEENISEIADLASGYSGADMKSLCAEASLGPIRSIDISMIQNIQADQVRSITMQDFRSALNRVRASVSPGDLEQYVAWDQTYGAGGW